VPVEHKLSEEALTSLDYYFNALVQFGYKNQEDVNKLLVYLFIEEFLNGEMRIFITNQDYRTIQEALYCLYGNTCLIPFPKQYGHDNLFGHPYFEGPIIPRLTEDSNLRHTELDDIRLKA
jgi:hypothetical protein